jgi:predicted transcriptional regulator
MGLDTMYVYVYYPGMTWADTIKRAIRRSGLSLLAVAKAANIDYPRVYLFMHGHNSRLDNAERIARAVGLELRPRRKKRGTNHA